MKFNNIALIPARSGSVRVPNKNILNVKGHPMLAYAITAAKNSGIFSDVIICTDSSYYAEIAQYYGASCYGLRDNTISHSKAPDKQWVEWLFSRYKDPADLFDFAFILRPTNPFRLSSTIIRAWDLFQQSTADTLRAVRNVNEHPGKMWVKHGEYIVPLIPLNYNNVPLHSNQTSALFEAFVQDASLEIFSVFNFIKTGNITGSSVIPFYSDELEGFDVNNLSDIEFMKKCLDAGTAKLETIHKLSWFDVRSHSES